ncbi:hypothetical protein N9L66_00495 [Porticoccaceae bacterium]|nr:hypothetical protein [Porticoccaceae bacterium]
MAKSSRINGLVELIERTESWTVEEVELVKHLLISLSNIHKAPELARWADQYPQKTLLVLGLIKTGVGFEILKALDAAHEGLEAKLVSLSFVNKDDPFLKQLASRISVIERSELSLSEIFTPKRLARVNAAMSGAANA